jgi:hypothetical protein
MKLELGSNLSVGMLVPYDVLEATKPRANHVVTPRALLTPKSKHRINLSGAASRDVTGREASAPKDHPDTKIDNWIELTDGNIASKNN